ncbi:PREDICTED: EMBRYONIC FLOWER 1 [Prunus dulcis]|uniref:PREDICTED: EMBRYONIC FLOWER 1 n=2 Tax=Prunus dulcis TaxID=3755 RepID=A0A5E4G7W5_PRUDU|nr:PREDICTED: EMBRYONIC FLOWER 1 [Prunus dulcis]
MKPQNISKSSICSINRNPADLNMPEVGNGYMIRGEDLKFGKRIPFSRRHGLVKVDQHKWQRNMKALYQRGNVHHIEFDEGNFFQEKAREVDEESNEMILRTRNIEIQGETVLEYCMDILFSKKRHVKQIMSQMKSL